MPFFSALDINGIPLERPSLEARLFGSKFKRFIRTPSGEKKLAEPHEFAEASIVFPKIVWPSKLSSHDCETCNILSPLYTERGKDIDTLPYTDQAIVWKKCYDIATAHNDVGAMRHYFFWNRNSMEAVTQDITLAKTKVSTLRQKKTKILRRHLALYALLERTSDDLNWEDFRDELENRKLEAERGLHRLQKANQKILGLAAGARVFADLGSEWKRSWASLGQELTRNYAMAKVREKVSGLLEMKRGLRWSGAESAGKVRGWTGLTPEEVVDGGCKFVKIGGVRKRLGKTLVVDKDGRPAELDWRAMLRRRSGVVGCCCNERGS